ncbi:hypothetical protein DFR29_103302 [Tahibacter aquaticus]|uniref:Uncharacterized protein n=1 Tax=Tahibacter aquaticus TaxID=520092 RepID=A0A4V3DN20_9GAMM|nr:hypothetical protein DFR29_103302 [Tahibacter aquaticus]
MSHVLKSKASDLTQKDLWFKAFIASLHRTDPKAAAADADEAVDVCNGRWSGQQPTIGSLNNRHDYPVGRTFA